MVLGVTKSEIMYVMCTVLYVVCASKNRPVADINSVFCLVHDSLDIDFVGTSEHECGWMVD